MKNRGGLLALAVFLIILNAFFVKGFGVATPYFDNNTIKLSPGQTYAYTFSVQNGDDSSYNVSITISSDLAAKLRPGNNFIKSKTYDNKFTIDITVPKNATIGESYTVSYTVRPVIDNGGQVSLTVELPRSVDILVVPADGSQIYENKVAWYDEYISKYSYYIYGLLLTALIIIIFFIMRRLWKISKKLSEKVLNKRAPYAISDARNVEEITVLVKMMSQNEYELQEIRHIISDRLKDLDYEKLAYRVMDITKKDHAVKALSRVR